jgi:hypothetical protein
MPKDNDEWIKTDAGVFIPKELKIEFNLERVTSRVQVKGFSNQNAKTI